MIYTSGSQPVVHRPSVVRGHPPGGLQAKATFYFVII